MLHSECEAEFDGMPCLLPSCCLVGSILCYILYWMGNWFRGSEPRDIKLGEAYARLAGKPCSCLYLIFFFFGHLGAGFTLWSGSFFYVAEMQLGLRGSLWHFEEERCVCSEQHADMSRRIYDYSNEDIFNIRSAQWIKPLVDWLSW